MATTYLTRLWRATRTLVPTQVYPWLAPAYRWRRRRQLAQLEADDRTYRAAHPGVLAPAADLRFNVAGPCTIPQFFAMGDRMLDDIEAALQSVGAPLSPGTRFLDFGCGVGRLVLAMRRRELQLDISGCDVDRRAVDWCHAQLPDVPVRLNAELPPAPFPDAAFDVIWCGSVFTHLDERHQDVWLAELRRMLAPGGVLLASVHGPKAWEPLLPSWAIRKVQRQGLVFTRTDADAGVHPEWYQVAWHTEAYIRQHWQAYLDVRRYIPRGLNDHQDLVVASKAR